MLNKNIEFKKPKSEKWKINTEKENKVNMEKKNSNQTEGLRLELSWS